jgi:hypothetical protein
MMLLISDVYRIHHGLYQYITMVHLRPNFSYLLRLIHLTLKQKEIISPCLDKHFEVIKQIDGEWCRICQNKGSTVPVWYPLSGNRACIARNWTLAVSFVVVHLTVSTITVELINPGPWNSSSSSSLQRFCVIYRTKLSSRSERSASRNMVMMVPQRGAVGVQLLSRASEQVFIPRPGLCS